MGSGCALFISRIIVGIVFEFQPLNKKLYKRKKCNAKQKSNYLVTFDPWSGISDPEKIDQASVRKKNTK
ncbi:hypothetical protein RUM43_007249 [Polyplax serrata]|uniref:Uncharacterized protein n=1 Tax=Polyplax serrata TaxID=468196 RepID=A0AAN8P1L8_POLSC